MIMTVPGQEQEPLLVGDWRFHPCGFVCWGEKERQVISRSGHQQGTEKQAFRDQENLVRMDWGILAGIP